MHMHIWAYASRAEACQHDCDAHRCADRRHKVTGALLARAGRARVVEATTAAVHSPVVTQLAIWPRRCIAARVAAAKLAPSFSWRRGAVAADASGVVAVRGVGAALDLGRLGREAPIARFERQRRHRHAAHSHFARGASAT
eukprot:scaffold47087_cov76-Phaeocystis_antarctica.AAC.1